MKNINPIGAVRSAFAGQRRLRPERNVHFGGFEAVKSHPLGIIRFRPDEGGTVSTALNIKLAPVNGYMRSKAYVDVKQVFVPYQAIELLELDDLDAGVTEMTKRRLMAGEGIGFEDEGTITGAANIFGRSIAGNKRLTKTARLAYIAAVNHLLKASYHGATTYEKTETAILPAILAANMLRRFNGVLEPEKHIDGAINLTGMLPVKGIGTVAAGGYSWGLKTGFQETGGETRTTSYSGHGATAANPVIAQDPDNAGFPLVEVDMSAAADITLRDMVESKKLDGLIRMFAQMIQDDPINGEEAVERALYGMSVDYDANCQVVFDETYELTASHTRPTDGASINDISAHFEMNESIATLVPRSQLGGQLVTIVSVRPLETTSNQPNPSQTEVWEVINRVHDETELDEKLLTRADLENDLLASDEDTPAFWVGHNSLKFDYSTQNVNAQQVLGVEVKSSMWTYEVPTSVTPENVSYPADGIDMYPYANWAGPHAEYTISQVAAISTPLAKGPNPVERIQLFADDASLL